MRLGEKIIIEELNLEFGEYTADPQENCHLTVKQLPKT